MTIPATASATFGPCHSPRDNTIHFMHVGPDLSHFSVTDKTDYYVCMSNQQPHLFKRGLDVTQDMTKPHQLHCGDSEMVTQRWRLRDGDSEMETQRWRMLLLERCASRHT